MKIKSNKKYFNMNLHLKDDTGVELIAYQGKLQQDTSLSKQFLSF